MSLNEVQELSQSCDTREGTLACPLETIIWSSFRTLSVSLGSGEVARFATAPE